MPNHRIHIHLIFIAMIWSFNNHPICNSHKLHFPLLLNLQANNARNEGVAAKTLYIILVMLSASSEWAPYDALRFRIDQPIKLL